MRSDRPACGFRSDEMIANVVLVALNGSADSVALGPAKVARHDL